MCEVSKVNAFKNFSYRKISVSCPTPLSGRKSRVLHVVKCTQMFLEKEDSLGVPETGSPQSRGECCKSHNSRTKTSAKILSEKKIASQPSNR